MNATLFDNVVRPTAGFVLCDFQLHDTDLICRLWEEGQRRVLGVFATGLGKSVIVAELLRRKPDGRLALGVVDSTDLAYDLFRTITKHTGQKPGLLTGDFKEGLDREIIIATKQCLCAADKYRNLDELASVERLVIDECEAALANEYLLMVNHFLEANDKIKIAGLTATPLPAGNRAITDIFSYAAKEPGPLYRDLQWAYLNGWLVKPMQGALRCSMDFASLKVRKQENGERDYSDRDIAKLMLEQDERQWLELAGGIYQITKGQTTIVVCPNSTLVADKLAGYIEGHARDDGHSNIAYAIHRRLGRRDSWDLMRRFKKGEFPIAVSVRMFEKGFDYDKVTMIVMVRRTRSLRLYTQIAGRGTRPLATLRQQLLAEADPKERMRMIAESEKPSCVMVDCVGINDQAKNILGVIDILGRGVRDDIKERVRRMMLDRARKQENQNDGPPGVDVGDEAREAVKQLRYEWEQERARRSRVSADVDVAFSLHPAAHARQPKKERGARMPFGKYRGQLIRNLSTGYLSTLRANVPISQHWLANSIDRELANRKQEKAG